VLLINKLVVFS